MKLTLLEMVQDILNDLDYDFVNSLSDTPEALQVATIIRTTYFELLTLREWPHTQKIARLYASTDLEKPNYLKLADEIYSLDWVKYNKRTLQDSGDKYRDVHLISPAEFMDRVNRRDSSKDNVIKVKDFNDVTLLIVNDKAPEYVTTFDDEWLVFDSYDKSVDTTLQASKCQALIVEEPLFIIKDDFVPDMPSKAFPYLLAEAKSVCFNTLKQLPNQKEEQRSRRQRTRLAREKYRVGNYILNERPDWGRKHRR